MCKKTEVYHNIERIKEHDGVQGAVNLTLHTGNKRESSLREAE